MKDVPEGLLGALEGSATNTTIQFNVWYGGNLVYPDLPVSEWSHLWEASRQVNGQCSATVIDDSGNLAPWGADDILGVGGSILQSTIIVDDLSLDLSWQRISKSDPDETWQLGRDGLTWISGSATIPIEAEDLTLVVAGSRFMSPEAPREDATVKQEIVRLLSGIMLVQFDAGITDKQVPKSIVYQEERMDAVDDLVAAINCRQRMTADGRMHVYLPPDDTPVWTARGRAEGNLIQVSRAQDITTLTNAVVSRNTLENGRELQSIATQRVGPLATTGPHNIWPMSREANFALDQVAIAKDANTALANKIEDRVVEIPLRTVLHPGLEINDQIQVMVPTILGDETALKGRVTTISYGGGLALPVAMDVTMECKQRDIQNVSDMLRKARWGRNL